MIGSSRSIGNTSRRESASTTDEYRRRARRLRRMYAHQPVFLQRKLKELSGSQEPEIRPMNPSLTGGSPVAWEFAESVEEAIQSGILRYSQRMTLIQKAEGLGIKRFEANLIIAVVEHRARESTRTVQSEPVKPRGKWILPATLAISLQIVIVLFAYFSL
ncbi:MAG TPA: hypothetical protein VFE58_09815 [Tepidisphaeraceae bacterium]|jgi:hypothetical protein|nr:hypothetical protein [Tepidisphaeraceae bacterium]